MVPKFRCWDERLGLTEVVSIDFFRKKIKINHWEYGDSNFFPLDEVVLMQSTGLKDKNGVEVFQGDIVRCTRGCPHEVVWLQEYAGMYIGGMPAWYLSGLSEGYAWTGDEEIIGNIYENQELLEQANA